MQNKERTEFHGSRNLINNVVYIYYNLLPCNVQWPKRYRQVEYYMELCEHAKFYFIQQTFFKMIQVVKQNALNIIIFMSRRTSLITPKFNRR